MARNITHHSLKSVLAFENTNAYTYHTHAHKARHTERVNWNILQEVEYGIMLYE